MGTTNKKVYFELMRILSCGLVIFNHLKGYTLYQISSGSKQFFYMCLTMITRINVPIFFMISGALLLKKNEDIQFVIKKRILRVVILLLVFEGAIFTLNKYCALRDGLEYEYTFVKYIYGFFKRDIDGTVAYWYMYAYLGFLFALPFMQRIAKEFKKMDFIVIVALHFITSSLLPMLNILLVKANLPKLTLSTDFQVPFAFVKAFFYPLLGYYLEYHVDVTKFKAKHLISLIGLGITGIVLSNLCTLYEGRTTGKYTQNYVQLFDYLTAIVVFLIVKYLFVAKRPSLSSGKIGKVICFCGSLTLGIYLLEPFFKKLWFDKYNAWAEPLLPTLLVSIGWVVISMILGSLVTFVMKKIPGVKKLL